MLRKAIDANIIVYSLLEDHPAAQVCDSLLRGDRYDFYTTPLTPFEVYYALRNVYGIEREKASKKALSLFESPLKFSVMSPEHAKAALERCIVHGLDSNDSLLIELCLSSQIPSLASDDRRLLKTCGEMGIQPQSPVSEDQRLMMRLWEDEKLPKSGLLRLLKRIHGWLNDINPETAEKFFEDSDGLHHIP